ncbi:MAG TPA: putative toxin-antitoxin system toxin component, PIN family [Candidatus Sulfotelmatobacter sp.]
MLHEDDRTIQVVLDTNVVVSAHLNSEGYERHVLDLALAGKIKVVASEGILSEYEGVPRRPKFGLSPSKVSRSIRLLRKAARSVTPHRILAVARDPTDNRFLECAETARADFLVTGNKRYFHKQWRPSVVMNARELLERIIPELQW